MQPWWTPFTDCVSGGKEKDAHDWQQSVAEAEHFIGALCPKGGIVLDPMVGSGTSGVAAVTLGMEFVGVECDPDAFAVAQERIEKGSGVDGKDGVRQAS